MGRAWPCRPLRGTQVAVAGSDSYFKSLLALMWRMDYEWREELHTESLPSVVIGENSGDLK